MMLSAITITFFWCPKDWSSLHWKASLATVAPKGITVYLNLPSSMLKVVRKDEASSSFWCQKPFLQLHTNIIQGSASKWAMSSGVLKWYGALTITLFRLVGSKQILNFKFPSLSFPSTSTNLIHGMASCTGFRTSALSILSISCWTASFKCTSIGLQGVCLGVTLWSIWIWYGRTAKHPIPSKTSSSFVTSGLCLWLTWE